MMLGALSENPFDDVKVITINSFVLILSTY